MKHIEWVALGGNKSFISDIMYIMSMTQLITSRTDPIS